MAVRVLSQVWDGYPGGGAELLALLALADWCDDMGRCYPSIRSIARKVRLSEKQARRIVHKLAQEGFVKVTGGATGGAMSRRYQIDLGRLTPPIQGSPPVKGSPPAGVHKPLPPVGGDPSHSYGSRTVIEPSVEPSGSAVAGVGAVSIAKTGKSPVLASAVGDVDSETSSPMSAKETVWSLGPALLGERQRSFLGKLVATYGEGLVASVLADCAKEKPGEPKSWVVAACASRQQGRKSGAGASLDALSNPAPWWAVSAGFKTRFEAENAGCTERNHKSFKNGRKAAA